MARFNWVVVLLLMMNVAPASGQQIADESNVPLTAQFHSTSAVLPDDSRVVLEAFDERPAPVRREHRVIDKTWLALGFTLGSAMSVDTYSTFRSLSWCPACREDNPYAAPFVNRGPVVAYSLGIAFDVSVMGAAAALRKAANPALRKIWWAPAALLIVGHSLAARHNYDLQRVCERNPRCGRVP